MLQLLLPSEIGSRCLTLSNSAPKLHAQPICWDAFMMQHSWCVKLHIIQVQLLRFYRQKYTYTLPSPVNSGFPQPFVAGIAQFEVLHAYVSVRIDDIRRYLFLINFAVLLILSLKQKITGSCAGLDFVFKHACNQMSVVRERSQMGVGHSTSVICYCIVVAYNVLKITELLALHGCSSPVERHPWYRVPSLALLLTKHPWSHLCTRYFRRRCVVVSPNSLFSRSSWIVQFLPAAGRAGSFGEDCGDGGVPRGAAQVCRVLGRKRRSLWARLMLKDSLGVTGGRRRGFDEKLVCTRREG